MVAKAIYVLRDPITDEIRYVGATASSLSKRLALHLVLSRKSTTKCAAWVRGLVSDGAKPKIEGVMPSDTDWQILETQAIALLRFAGFSILNSTDGGMGCWGCFPDANTRAKRSKTLKSRYANDPRQMAIRQELMRNAARSPAARKAASERMRSIWSDPVRSAEMRARMKGAKKRTKQHA